MQLDEFMAGHLLYILQKDFYFLASSCARFSGMRIALKRANMEGTKLWKGVKKKNRGTRYTKREGELATLYFLFIDNRDKSQKELGPI